MTSATESSVAIIGGGMYGSSLAQQLACKRLPGVSITLYTLHDHAVNIAACVRLFNGYDGETISYRYSNYLDPSIKLKIVYKIHNFDEHSVSYSLKSDPEKILTDNFDVIVIATGAKWQYPIDFNSITDITPQGIDTYVAPVNKQLKAAKRIVVVGGGNAGCELVGELAHAYKAEIAAGKKEIILVHSRANILDERIIDRTRRSIEEQLKSLGVKFVFGTKVLFGESDERNLKLTNGDTITEVDIVLKTTGISANVPATTLKDLTDEMGYIKVSTTLQTIKYPSVFAIGDVTQFETKSLHLKKHMIAAALHNVQQVLNGKSNFKIYTKDVKKSEYKPVYVLSLGPHNAAGQLDLGFFGMVNVWTWLFVKLKSEKLLVDRHRNFFEEKRM